MTLEVAVVHDREGSVRQAQAAGVLEGIDDADAVYTWLLDDGLLDELLLRFVGCRVRVAVEVLP